MVHIWTPSNPYKHDSFIRGLILDNDDTLHVGPPDAGSFHLEAGIGTVAHLLKISITEKEKQEVLQRMQESRKKYGGMLDFLFEEEKQDAATVREEHFSRLIKATQGDVYFTKERRMGRGLQVLEAQGVELFINTHGNEAWTEHSLQEDGLKGFFKDRARVLCKDDFPNYPSKNKSPAMVDETLRRMDISASLPLGEQGREVAFGDDTISNHRLYAERGILTILNSKVLHQRALEGRSILPPEVEDYVRVLVPEHYDIPRMVARSNRAYLERLDAKFSAITKLDYSDMDIA